MCEICIFPAFHGRQSQRNDVAAVSAGGQVLEYSRPLALRQGMLGKRRQLLCIGMATDRYASFQPLTYDLGNFLHLNFSFCPAPPEIVLAKLTPNTTASSGPFPDPCLYSLL